MLLVVVTLSVALLGRFEEASDPHACVTSSATHLLRMLMFAVSFLGSRNGHVEGEIRFGSAAGQAIARAGARV